MIVPHEGPGTWQSFLKRKDNIGLSIMEVKQKYLKEQLLFESYLNTVNTMSPSVASSAAGAGAAGGPLPSKGGGGGGLRSYLSFYNSGEVAGGYPPFDDGALFEEVPGLLYEGATGNTGGGAGYSSVFAFYFPPGGFYGSRNYFLFWTNQAGYNRWVWIVESTQAATSWKTLSNAQIATLMGNANFVYEASSLTSPTDINNPVGTYDYNFGKGQYIGAVTPTGYTRAQAISEFGVN